MTALSVECCIRSFLRFAFLAIKPAPDRLERQFQEGRHGARAHFPPGDRIELHAQLFGQLCLRKMPPLAPFLKFVAGHKCTIANGRQCVNPSVEIIFSRPLTRNTPMVEWRCRKSKGPE